jgi:hypothetical protein
MVDGQGCEYGLGSSLGLGFATVNRQLATFHPVGLISETEIQYV